MKMMTLDAAITEAVETRNIKLINGIAEKMMFLEGWTYERLYRKANEVTGISSGDWYELIAEAER